MLMFASTQNSCGAWWRVCQSHLLDRTRPTGSDHKHGGCIDLTLHVVLWPIKSRAFNVLFLCVRLARLLLSL